MVAARPGGEPRFLCDAMLGGLARWLRAAGYDCEFEHGIDDGDLVARARRSGQVVLSSDGGIFERSIVRDGVVAALYVPRDLRKVDQLAFVLRTLGLAVLAPRCMSCGGELVAVTKESVRAEAPPRAFAHHEQFWRCARCAKLLWRGTHWNRIARELALAAGGT